MRRFGLKFGKWLELLRRASGLELTLLRGRQEIYTNIVRSVSAIHMKIRCVHQGTFERACPSSITEDDCRLRRPWRFHVQICISRQWPISREEMCLHACHWRRHLFFYLPILRPLVACRLVLLSKELRVILRLIRAIWLWVPHLLLRKNDFGFILFMCLTTLALLALVSRRWTECPHQLRAQLVLHVLHRSCDCSTNPAQRA